jgi:hypothetical protein
MGGSDNNGNGGAHDSDSPLEAVVQRVVERQQLEAAELVDQTDGQPSEGEDLVHGWKRMTPGQPISLDQLHSGLLSVSQIAEAAIEMGVNITTDVRSIAHSVAQLAETVKALSDLTTGLRKDVHYLRDDVREVQERARLVPAIKDMLTDIILRLPS